MLVTFMDIDPGDDEDFNRWFDREHLAHRVSIDGFLEASRYIAHSATPKYFSIYWTDTFEVLTSPAYKDAVAHQTEWSVKNISRFKGMGRVIAHVTAGSGRGRGAALGVIRVRPDGQDAERLRARISEHLDPESQPGIISLHLIEGDPELSKSLTDPNNTAPGAGDWYILIEGTTMDAVSAATQRHRDGLETAVISDGTYLMMWNVTKADLGARPGS